MSELAHAEIEELLGAYVVDAVDTDERLAIDAHLPECPRCRAEVAELREVVAVLGNAGSPAPDGVWERIASSLEETPPPLRLTLLPRAADAAAPAAPTPAPAPAPRRSPLRWVAMGAAAALVATVIGAAGWTLRGNDSSNAPVALEQVATHALTEPGARLAVLHPSEPGDAPGGLVVVRANGEGYLVGKDLPDLGDRLYQLWGQTASGIVSLGVLNHPGVIGFTADDNISRFMVSEEDHQVDQPQHPVVLSGELS